MRRQIVFTFIQLLILQLSGQIENSFHPPLKIPMYLSANFGEIRPDHIHSGIDIKTQGTIGHQVYSIEHGYVSRIKVQANGYGKSIYVTHPNRYTSVYGHLNSYRDDIAAYVKNMQYKFQSHEVDLYLEPEVFPLSKGELIAYSGNTGGSSGPHLHFEVRSSSTQHPTNVLKYNFDIKDHVSPKFLSLYIYPMDEQGQINGSVRTFASPLVKDNGIYTIPYGTSVNGTGNLGISVEVFDYLDGASNRCAIYSLELFADDQLTYRYEMDEFDFQETRYINAHLYYEELITSGTKAHRLHRLPNDRLRTYDHLVRDGVLLINENRDYQLRIVAKDVAGNSSELKFKISGHSAEQSFKPAESKVKETMKYNEINRFEQDLVSVMIPEFALYQDMYFSIDKFPACSGSLTGFYQIGSETIPLQLPFNLTIKTEVTDRGLQDKLVILRIDNEGKLSAEGGEYKEGAVNASLKNFGKYAIGIDSISPSIIPLGETIGGDITGRKSLKFTILDDLSEIDQYEGYIDHQWALFEYDPKNDLLFYTFDKEKIKADTTHLIELYVSDSKGNTNLFQATFIW